MRINPSMPIMPNSAPTGPRKDANGRIVNPGDQIWAEGRCHFVDTVDKVNRQVRCGMNNFDCDKVEVRPR